MKVGVRINYETIHAQLQASLCRLLANSKSTLLGHAPIYTALRQMQTRSNDKNSVGASVGPSKACLQCDKTEEKSV